MGRPFRDSDPEAGRGLTVMRFATTPLPGVFVVELDPRCDERGSFARTYCRDEFAGAAVPLQVVQTNISHNNHALTLRGMHYQAAPHGEPKLIQCVRGKIWDVAIDLRPASPAYCRWTAVELSPASNRMFFIPEGCAHGFLTLEDDSDILYLMGARYNPEAARGVRWNDSCFAISWPSPPRDISERDATYPDFAGRAIN
jgi:dTDP-4-dehydrorhamnose 3,5-epimerase